MNPDMKRLCESVVRTGDSEGVALDTYTGLPEAIVRAVLTELREVSKDVADAGRWPAEDDGPVACFRAMVDAVLAEPATA